MWYYYLKITFRQYPAIPTNYIISHCTTLQYSHSVWYGTKAEKKSWIWKLMNSTVLPYFHFGMNRQCFATARLTWPTCDDCRKRENSSAWKDRIIVAFTCRCSVQFGCYITWLWMANCVSMMTKMLPFYNLTIPCHVRRTWKMSREACASAEGRFLIGWIHSIWGPCQPPLTLII